MKQSLRTEEEISLQVMAYLDGELSPEEKAEVRKLLEGDTRYQKAMQSLSEIKEATSDMKFKNVPEMFWDDYWKHVYNRIERGISWVLISIGAIILLSFGALEFLTFVLKDQSMHPVLKTGIVILMIGFVILIVSILREKLMVRKVDKYREIER